MANINVEDTITAISTPVGEGGIGIVRLSGAQSIEIADKIFDAASGRKLSDSKTHKVHFGTVQNPDTSEIVDEVLITIMRAPKSYTREDVIEINCHGGIQSVKRILGLAIKNGARIAEPGEFTKRAFLNGRIDLVQAEAVLDVIRSKTEGSLKVAMGQLDGELSSSINSLRESMLDLASELEAGIDFSEEDVGYTDNEKLCADIENIITDLEKLIGTYDRGSILREGVLAVICGKPNVGKSSLMNLLLKRDRVIVSPIPGTTRDAIEEMISLKGIPIRLADTAGIIDTKDRLEKEGISRSKKYLALADLVILVLDYSGKMTEADRKIINICKAKKKIVVLNKTDRPKNIDLKKVQDLFKGCGIVEISVEKRKNIEVLEETLERAIWSGGFSQGEAAIISNSRHKALLDKARSNMLSVKKEVKADEPAEIVAIDLKEAINSLGLIIGKEISSDILDRIFERFCIGK